MFHDINTIGTAIDMDIKGMDNGEARLKAVRQSMETANFDALLIPNTGNS